MIHVNLTKHDIPLTKEKKHSANNTFDTRIQMLANWQVSIFVPPNLDRPAVARFYVSPQSLETPMNHLYERIREMRVIVRE